MFITKREIFRLVYFWQKFHVVLSQRHLMGVRKKGICAPTGYYNLLTKKATIANSNRLRISSIGRETIFTIFHERSFSLDCKSARAASHLQSPIGKERGATYAAPPPYHAIRYCFSSHTNAYLFICAIIIYSGIYLFYTSNKLLFKVN